MNNKLICKKYFFIALFIYLTFAKNIVLPTPGGIGLYLSPNIIGWIFIALLISFGLWQVAINKKIIFSQSHLTIILGFFLLCIPVLYSQSNFSLSSPRILALAAGVILFILLSQLKFTQAQKHSILLLLLIGVAIEATFGLVQYYILLKYDLDITGYTPIHNIPYGTFTQANAMASFMVTGVALSLYLLKNVNFQAIINRKLYCLFLYYCLFASSLVMVLLQSKTGYVALLVVLIAFLPSLLRVKRHNKNITISLILGLSMGIFSLLSADRTDAPPVIEQDKHRLTMYLVGWEMIKEKPILGFGYGNFERNYRETYIKKMQEGKITKPPQNALIHPHNEILFWLIEGGIVAALGIIIIIYCCLSALKRTLMPQQLPLIALMVPILIHTQLEYPFYLSICHYLYFICFFWLITDSNSPKYELRQSYSLPLKVLAIIMPFIVIPFMLTTLHTAYLMEEYKKSSFSNNNYINDIINPVAWREYITITLQTESLKNGYKHRDVDKLKQYIYWGSEYVKQRPIEQLYQNMILAIDTLENVKQPIESKLKQKITNDAARLYPATK